jgi:hypothetical protein
MKKKIDRKAWIRIVEAFIAIVIILSAILIIMSRQTVTTDISESVYEKQKQILKIITENETLRNEVLQGKNVLINQTIKKMIPTSWNFETNICLIENVCPNPATVFDREVYTTEALVMSNLTEHNPQKLRFFVWVK